MADVQAPPLKVLQECGFKDEKEFRQRSATALDLLAGLGVLEEGKKVVDLGCTGHLPAAISAAGKKLSYHGVSLSVPVLKWCSEVFGKEHFNFSRIDVRHALRNPAGSILPEKVKLPFEDASVDAVYAESIFTTMTQDALRRYIKEIARVLKPGGRFIGTFFLLNGAVTVRISQRRTRHTFSHRLDTYCRAQDKERPGSPIAYNDSFIRMLATPAHLEVKKTIEGAWSGAEGAKGFEDVVIAEKLAVEEESPKQVVDTGNSATTPANTAQPSKEVPETT